MTLIFKGITTLLKGDKTFLLKIFTCSVELGKQPKHGTWERGVLFEVQNKFPNFGHFPNRLSFLQTGSCCLKRKRKRQIQFWRSKEATTLGLTWNHSFQQEITIPDHNRNIFLISMIQTVTQPSVMFSVHTINLFMTAVLRISKTTYHTVLDYQRWQTVSLWTETRFMQITSCTSYLPLHSNSVTPACHHNDGLTYD